MAGRILLIEDDPAMRERLSEALAAAGFAPLQAGTGGEGLALARAGDVDVVVLDRMLPDLSGLDVLARLRDEGVAAPVLLLTALGAVEDRVEGLRAGADDYLVKPFALPELLARIEVLMRRAPPSAEPETRLVCDDLELDLIARVATRGGRVIELQRMEFLLLEHLMRHAGQVVTRSMLLEGVWGYRFDPQTNVIDVHISRLRKKIDFEGAPSMIETLRGVGYRLAAAP